MSQIDDAFDAFEAGDLPAAMRICQAILGQDPQSFAAHYLLGTAFGEQKDWPAAERHLKEAVRLKPEQPAAAFNLANVQHELGDLAAALKTVTTACELKPQDDEFWILRSSLERQLCLTEEAKLSAKAVLDRNPSSPLAWMALGSALLAEGNALEALAAQDRAVTFAPDLAAAHVNRGNALMILDRVEEALSAFDRSLKLDASEANGLNGRALALAELHHYDEALEACHQSLALDDRNWHAHRVHGEILRRMRRPQDALLACDAALALKPDYAEGLLTRGQILCDLNEHEKALASLDAALVARKDFPEADANRSLVLLAMGEFAKGWPAYEQRMDVAFIQNKTLGTQKDLLAHVLRRPNASQLQDRKIVVIEEQGVGDTVMFASIVPDLLATAKEVGLVVNKRLAGLFQRSFPRAHIHALEQFSREDLLEHDAAILFGSLGHAFRSERAQFPTEAYLKPDPARVAKWREKLPQDGRKLIGLSWRGGTQNTNEIGRTLKLEDFTPLLMQDHHFVSLQYGDARTELAAYERATGKAILHFAPQETHDLDDLVALMACLDHVVTVQNTNVHLSGALGLRCSAIIPNAPEWRYGLSGSKMVWYDKVELLRRDTTGSIDTLMAHIAAQI